MERMEKPQSRRRRLGVPHQPWFQVSAGSVDTRVGWGM
jgi:hypothetical protein